MIKTPLSTVIGGAFWTPGATVIGGGSQPDKTPLMWSLVDTDLMWNPVSTTLMWSR
jgi:hypothetical protein